MTSRTPADAAAQHARIRPSDRREIVLRTASDVFGTRGYAATRLTDIAEEVGISAPALYRHFSNKYDLFAAAVDRLSEGVDAAVSGVAHRDDPREELRAVLAAFADTVMEHRSSGNLYRWERRVLHDADRTRTRDVRVALHRRLRSLIEAARPNLPRPLTDLLAVATLSVAASPATHRIAMGRRAATELVSTAAVTLLDVDFPDSPPTADRPPGLAPAGRRESILAAAVTLFAQRGFHEVTVEDIGAAVGLPASGVYRHFESKVAILAAALWRTADRATDAVAVALSQAQTPREALVSLTARYSELCVDDPDIMAIYLSGTGALDDGDLHALRRQQRTTVDEWATWVVRARPECSNAAARYLVHASLNLASDLVTGRPGVDAPTVAAASAAILLGDGAHGR
ncbi:TetR/AcrR family transcriptional regulator [Gordonia liuliyuniae]|uniref:TetR/AcrR family transcriptional regulator n=1 Tax=Gordonia liuliyuniae TaxID=2911517 RepID=A0ABS9IV58_9ACTN|nr:TetR/AcrR family transcriptional regulator [Gordonia liuliyuniae]MCF8589390.1 TetR/AcrR family transcriptional regulator [Gordonia liuliyuniae]